MIPITLAVTLVVVVMNLHSLTVNSASTGLLTDLQRNKNVHEILYLSHWRPAMARMRLHL